jgi:hypothetical protein
MAGARQPGLVLGTYVPRKGTLSNTYTVGNDVPWCTCHLSHGVLLRITRQQAVRPLYHDSGALHTQGMAVQGTRDAVRRTPGVWGAERERTDGTGTVAT